MRMSAIIVATVAIVGMTNVAHAKDEVRAEYNPVVVDGEGRRVGSLVGFGDYGLGDGLEPLVSVGAGGHVVVILASRNGFDSGDAQFSGRGLIGPWWDSTDCMGRPFYVRGGVPFSSASVVIDDKIYIVDGPSQSATLRSTGRNPGECTPIEQEADAIPLRFLADLEGVFTPPFSLK